MCFLCVSFFPYYSGLDVAVCTLPRMIYRRDDLMSNDLAAWVK